MSSWKTYIPAVLVFFILFIFSCTQQDRGNLPADLVTNPNSADGNSNKGLPVIHFDKDFHDFGKMIEGEKATFSFKFSNGGDADLIISQVNTTCGCTVPRYPKTPVKPGEEGAISVTFDTEGKKGMQQKSISVVSNCQPPQTVLWVKAMVIAN